MNDEVLTGEQAWEKVCAFVQNDGRFKSATGIVFESRVSGNRIYYKGGAKNGGREEDLFKDDFISAFNALPDKSATNINSIKDAVPDNFYKKRTSFIAILQGAKVLNA